MSPKYVVKEETDLWGNPQTVVRRGVTSYEVGSALGTLAGLAIAAHRSGKQQQFDNAVAKVMGYFEKGDFKSAITQADELLKLDTVESKLAAHLLKAQVYSEIKEYTKAITEFTAVIDIADTHKIPDWKRTSSDGESAEARTLYLRGMCYFNSQQWGPAITDFKKCTQIAPNDPGSHLYLAVCLQKIGDLDQALTYLNRLVELAPGEANCYLIRGRVYVDRLDHEKAIADFSRAIKLAPQEQEAYKLRSEAYLILGDEEKSREDLQRISLLEEAKEIPALDELISEMQAQKELAEITQTLQQTEEEWGEQEKIYQQVTMPFDKFSTRSIYTGAASLFVGLLATMFNLLPEWMLLVILVGVAVILLGISILFTMSVSKTPKRYLELKEQRNELEAKKAEMTSKLADPKRIEQLRQRFGNNISLDALIEMRKKRIRQIQNP
ncbi:MAG: tetratricopeptide repeat protein [Caldilineaceae bacterium]|nr:tetratricopeptide repeat protein [Caldilineaceae bacterium]